MTASGPWFTHHFKRPGADFDFEICVPVERAIAPGGRVSPGIWPAMRVARTVYRGDYAGLAAAWGEFEVWIETWLRGSTAAWSVREADDLWERYLVNPDSTGKPEDWRTELSRPLLDSVLPITTLSSS